MEITLYGIPNCDQVKKARAWLAAHSIEFAFHDFKKAGISQPMLDAWLSQVGWETLLNKKGTTWRTLSDSRKAEVTDAAKAVELMLEQPSVVKRPVLVTPKAVHIGFSEALYQQIFKK